MQPHTAPRAHRTCCVSPRSPGGRSCPDLIPGCSFSHHRSQPASTPGKGGTHTECGQIPLVSHHIILHPCKLPKVIEPPPSSLPSLSSFPAPCIPHSSPMECARCPWQNSSPQKSPQCLLPEQTDNDPDWKGNYSPPLLPKPCKCAGELMQLVHIILSDKYTPHILVILAD